MLKLKSVYTGHEFLYFRKDQNKKKPWNKATVNNEWFTVCTENITYHMVDVLNLKRECFGGFCSVKYVCHLS